MHTTDFFFSILPKGFVVLVLDQDIWEQSSELCSSMGLNCDNEDNEDSLSLSFSKVLLQSFILLRDSYI